MHVHCTRRIGILLAAAAPKQDVVQVSASKERLYSTVDESSFKVQFQGTEAVMAGCYIDVGTRLLACRS